MMIPASVAALFIDIAEKAMDRGREIRLERKGYNSGSKALNGFLTNTQSTDTGLVLHVYAPEAGDTAGGASPAPTEEDDPEGEDDQEEEDDPEEEDNPEEEEGDDGD